MARKTIQRAQSEDLTIMEEGTKIGTIRIKPSGILWKPKGKRYWFGLTLDKFASLAEEHGRHQDS